MACFIEEKCQFLVTIETGEETSGQSKRPGKWYVCAEYLERTEYGTKKLINKNNGQMSQWGDTKEFVYSHTEIVCCPA